jgi:hypothetical protein
MTWHFVILGDSDARVHLGDLVAGDSSKPAEYVRGESLTSNTVHASNLAHMFRF